MSNSNDPTSPDYKLLQDYCFFGSNETGMTFSDVLKQNQTQQDQQGRQQTSSFLRSTETDMPFPVASTINASLEYPRYLGKATMNTEGTLFNGNQTNSYLDYELESLHCQLSEKPTYLQSDSIAATTSTMNTRGNISNGIHSNSSLDYRRNMNSQQNTGTGLVKSGTYNSTTNYGQSCLPIEASTNSGRYGTNITDSFGCGSLYSGVTSDGMMTNTHNTYPSSFQSVPATSSSLVPSQPKWTVTLSMNDLSIIFYLDALFVEDHILKHLHELYPAEPGYMVKVYDHDTNTTHDVCLGLVQPDYILWKGWKTEFVDRRRLRSGEHIGFLWDHSGLMLHFSVLSRPLYNVPVGKKKLLIQ